MERKKKKVCVVGIVLSSHRGGSSRFIESGS